MGKLIIKQSILSGILISIGTLVYIKIENKYLGAALFSLALLVILKQSLPLYTGQIGMIQSLKQLPNLLCKLFFNILGSTIPIIMFTVVGKEFQAEILRLSILKYDRSIAYLFVAAFFCGIIMNIAITCKDNIITIFGIMTFILAGFEHCIADFPYLIELLMTDFDILYIVKYIIIVLGNSLGAILTNNLIKERKKIGSGH